MFIDHLLFARPCAHITSMTPHNKPGIVLGHFTDNEINVQRGLIDWSKIAQLWVWEAGVTTRYDSVSTVVTLSQPCPCMLVEWLSAT